MLELSFGNCAGVARWSSLPREMNLFIEDRNEIKAYCQHRHCQESGTAAQR